MTTPLPTAPPALTFLAHDSDAPSIVPVPIGSVAMYSARCPGKATANEDSAAVIPCKQGESLVLAVADGLGGLRAGELASATTIECLRVALAAVVSPEDSLRSAVINGIEQANQAVMNLGLGTATTLALVTIDDGHVRSYHVGDSDVLVVGQRGKRKLETISHSPVGFALEAGLLNERQAMQHKDRHIVSNVIGTPEMRIEIGSSFKLARYDTVVLASDGLRDNLRLSEIVKRVRKGSLASNAAALAADARRRMMTPAEGEPSKPDDLTVVLFRLGARSSTATRPAPAETSPAPSAV